MALKVNFNRMVRLIQFIALLFIAGACVNVAKQKPEAVGSGGEITVFIQTDYRDQGIETAVDSILDRTVYAGYTVEPMFDVKYQSDTLPEDLLDINLIEININEENEPQVFEKSEGLNARGQFQLIVYANSVDNAIKLIYEHGKNIRDALNNNEYDRTYKRLSFGQRTSFSSRIADKQQVDILIPSYLDDFLYNSPEFSLVSGYQTAQSKTGKLMIQQYLYVMNFADNGDSLNFTNEGLLWQINNYLKSWALLEDTDPGGNAYMQIANNESVVPFETFDSKYRDMPSMEMRGNMASYDPNGSMPSYGGYFKGLAVRDLKNERIIVAIGMANVPKDILYREYLRQMNVLIHTLQF